MTSPAWMQTQVAKARRLLSSAWAFPLTALALTVLAYGVLIPWLGFYWDDWPKAWFQHLLGPQGFPQVYSSDRPFLGYFYLLTTPWIGQRPIAWQLFGLVTRWLSGITLWWTFRQLWPRHSRQVAWVALLFLLYPGFDQQWISLIYSHFFALLALSIFSLGAMIRAARTPARAKPLTLLALAAQAVSLFSVEYFFGMELLRGLILWITLGQDEAPGRRRLTRFIARWFPYLAVAVSYLAWRVFVLRFPTYQPQLLEGLTSDPWVTLGRLLYTVAADMVEVGALAWIETFRLPDVAILGGRSVLVYGGLVLVSGVLAAVCAAGGRLGPRRDGRTGEASGRPWTREALLVGLAGMLLAGIPVWVTGLPIGLGFPWDRLTLPLMLGAALVLVAAIEILVRPGGLKLAVFAVLVAFSVGHHFQSATAYRRDWQGQRQLFWQLSWRAPGLEPGTTLLTNEMPLYESDNSLTAPLNWIYAPRHESQAMPYMLYYVTVRLGRGLPGLQPGLPIRQWYRAANFEGSTSRVLAVFYSPPGCVRVLDEILDDSMAKLPRMLAEAVPLSRLDLIDVDAEPAMRPPQEIFGPEPPHGWCYFFESADLARQRAEWERVAELGDEAYQLSDRPNDASERLVFVEGYARTGRMDEAIRLSREAIQHDAAVLPMVCNTWRRLGADAILAKGTEPTIEVVEQELGCKAKSR